MIDEVFDPALATYCDDCGEILIAYGPGEHVKTTCSRCTTRQHNAASLARSARRRQAVRS